MATFVFSVHANPGYMRFVSLTLYWIVVGIPSMLKLQLKNLIIMHSEGLSLAQID